MTSVNPKGIRTISERLTDDGASDLSDAELLSLFINAKNGVSPIERASAFLNRVTLMELLRKPYCAEYRALGISSRQHSQIKAGMELAKRSVMSELVRKDVLSSPSDVRKYIALHIAGLEHEVFGAIWLDNRHRVIKIQPAIFRGCIDSAAVYPREIVKECLTCNSAAVLFFHTHPSSVSEPSDTDVRLTRKLTDALNLIDVRVLDHLIVSQGSFVSLAERGLM